MTSSKFYNNTKIRLNRKGYKGYTKEDYQNAADYVGAFDLNNPTDEQLNQAVEYLIQQRDKANSVLTSIDSVVPDLEQAESENLEPKVLEDEAEITLAQHPPPESNQLTVAEKHQLAVDKATQINCSLSVAEIVNVADKLDSSVSSDEEFLDQIESALISYLEHQQQQLLARNTQLFNRVSDKTNQVFGIVNTDRAEKITSLVDGIEVAQQKTKSETEQLLSRLAKKR